MMRHRSSSKNYEVQAYRAEDKSHGMEAKEKVLDIRMKQLAAMKEIHKTSPLMTDDQIIQAFPELKDSIDMPL